MGLALALGANDATAEPPDANPDAIDAGDGDLGAIDDSEAAAQPEPEPEPEDQSESESGASADGDAEPIRPPRVDGPYVGLQAFGAINFPSVLDLDTPAPLIGGGGFIQAGDAVFRWMSIGVMAGGYSGFTGDQQLAGGGLLVELGFLPAPRYPLSLRVGFGFGGGSVREAGVEGRSGFGGAMFKGSLRYDFFPTAAKRRPDRGGGWSIGPELGWLGATPAGPNQPFVNTVLLGLSTAFYFGS